MTIKIILVYELKQSSQGMLGGNALVTCWSSFCKQLDCIAFAVVCDALVIRSDGLPNDGFWGSSLSALTGLLPVFSAKEFNFVG